MRIAEYKPVSYQQETKTRIVPDEYDENGCITVPAHEEQYEVTVPVMDLVYRDMTPEEEAEYLASQPEPMHEVPTQADRIEAQVLYTALMTATLLEDA